MASAQSRSGTRGRPPPKRWVFTCTGSSGCNCAHNSSEMRNPVVVPLFGVRSRSRFLVSCLFIPPILLRFRVIRIGTKLDELITRTYTLDQINEAYADMLAGK